MKRPKRPDGRTYLAAIFGLVVLMAAGPQALAQAPKGAPPSRIREASVYTGMLDRTPISGCCSKQDSQMGFGLIVRLPEIGTLGDIELTGFSDLKWSEMSISRYQFLFGDRPKTDPNSSPDVTVTYVKTWSLVWSYGVGFFSQSTKTKAFNRATVTVGIQPITRFTLTRSLSDLWYLTVTGSAGFSISDLDQNFNMGGGVGIGYRF